MTGLSGLSEPNQQIEAGQVRFRIKGRLVTCGRRPKGEVGADLVPMSAIARRNGCHGLDRENRVGLREIRRVSRREISQAGRDALARARFNFWALFNFLVHPAGSRKYGGGSCNPSVLRSYFTPA
jgi:hypothetical protein